MNINCVLLANGDKQEVVALTRQLELTRLNIGSLKVASTLRETLWLAASECPDVVLLELDLDDSKSLNTLRAVRAKTDAAVVVIHQGDDEVLGVRAIRLGADDFLFRRSMTAEQLRHSVLHAIARRQRQIVACRVQRKMDFLSTAAGV